jgi:Protein of unknown function (DUF3631)
VDDHQINGVGVLNELQSWFSRFICVTDKRDLDLLALFTVSTYLARELYTTPRIQIDSVLPESGKTTVLDHLSRLACRPVQAASLSSPALLPRLLDTGIRTVLLDEIDRSLSPDKPGIQDLLAILNSGYRFGASRPVLVQRGNSWEAKEMSTFSPVVMAGNNPNLPDDTRSRIIRVLMMPDLYGVAEDSDWEFIEPDALSLQATVEQFADQIRDDVAGMTVDLPDGCTGRSREKWRPLKRVAIAAGGDGYWPDTVDDLIRRDLETTKAEREAGLGTLPPGMVALTDLYAVWPRDRPFVSSRELVDLLKLYNPEYWGPASTSGKPLTERRLGHLASQAAKVTSRRPDTHGPRGYVRAELANAWKRLGIEPESTGQFGSTGYSGSIGSIALRDSRIGRISRIEMGTQECGANGEIPGQGALWGEDIPL